ncbi:AraC family transcriptional regulator [Neptunicella marina]|uniref:AraC family transcriptional regulator n=2 Tax=Neptunicella marina TaxID=2125989 RepID=A0A8J6IV48_9ALTE|nr:AraC family transcriptional regulator [Neptunicella marina]
MAGATTVSSLCSEIAAKIVKRTLLMQLNQTDISGLEFYRQDTPTECSTCVVEPSIALVVQGRKSMMLGEHTFTYDPTRFLITSLDLPARMQVLTASSQKPYLGVVLKLDLAVLSELILQLPLKKSVSGTESGMMLGHSSVELYDAFSRLISLLDEPESLPVLAPVIKREIFWRVLLSEQGQRLRHIVADGSQGLRFVRSVEWLKNHFSEPLRVEALAELATMSKSTFHHHFRQLTSMSPLQYQKRLRLMEARRLMLSESLDASAAAYRVGYESPSQFSREYSRLFGNSPRRDIDLHWQKFAQLNTADTTATMQF